MQWGPDTDAKLFMHVMAISKVKVDYQALAIAMGNDCTPKAIKHRMARLRAQAADQNTAASASNPTSTVLAAIKHIPPPQSHTPISAPPNTAGPSPATPTGKTKTATISTTGIQKSPPAKNAKLGAASAGSKRTATGEVKLKIRLMRTELKDKGTVGTEMEVETPSKKRKSSDLNVDSIVR